MATKTVTQLVDDMDGEPLQEDNAEQVNFALDGRHYRLDLSHKHADEFRGLFQEAISRATKIGSARQGNKATASGQHSNAAEVRAWAKDNGVDVPERGRIPQGVRDQFDAR